MLVKATDKNVLIEWITKATITKYSYIFLPRYKQARPQLNQYWLLQKDWEKAL